MRTSVILSLTGVAVIVAFSIFEFRDWLRTAPEGGESGASTVRNLGLVLAALFAFPLAIWRGFAADRQATASKRQAETAQRALLNNRYQKSAEMLGHERLSVRLGGIHALWSLAEEYPEGFHLPTVRLFCAFIRHPTEDKSLKTVRNRDRIQLREDMREIISLVVKRNSTQRAIERKSDFKLDFNRAILPGASFAGAKLEGAEFFLADMSRTSFENTDLSTASFRGAKLNRTSFAGTNLSGALFASPFQSEEDDYWKGFHELVEDEDDPNYLDWQDSAKGLTQQQLDEAHADPENPPYVAGIRDADTDLELKAPQIRVKSG